MLPLVLLAVACRPPGPREALFHGPTMGTTYHVKVVLATAPEAGWQERISQLIDERLQAVDQAMSTYREDSELSRLNRHVEGNPFPLSAATFEVLGESLRISGLTEGAFDMTVGPLVDAWGFGPELQARPTGPDASRLQELRSRVGYGLLTLDPETRTASKGHPELRCDLSGIAKGYAADRVADALATTGLESFMVEVGGEVVARGRRADGEPWRIGVERPLEEGRAVQRVVPLVDLAMATSGDYRIYREVDGERLSHLIDPRSGRPIRHRLASVTVLHERCAVADALATGLMIAGPRAALDLAESEDLALLLLVRDSEGGFEERTSSAFDRLLKSEVALAAAPSSD